VSECLDKVIEKDVRLVAGSELISSVPTTKRREVGEDESGE
jgi:hypothetical protein